MGSSLAALWAGITPKPRPMLPETAKEIIIDAEETPADNGETMPTNVTKLTPVKTPITPLMKTMPVNCLNYSPLARATLQDLVIIPLLPSKTSLKRPKHSQGGGILDIIVAMA